MSFDFSNQTTTAFHDNLKIARRHFSVLGLGLFAILAISAVLQLVAAGIVEFVWPQGERPSWVLWLCTFVPMYFVAVPIGLLIMKRVPAVPREKNVLKPGSFMVVAIISIFVMYAGNIFGNIVMILIRAVLGVSSVNPVLTYVMDGSIWLRILVMVILAPAIEEYIFRKQLIDRICIYGERLAVVTSALIFGLFHGNLSQFFYAFALGLVFGYIYLKTGRLRYSTVLHMMINLLGGVLAPALLSKVNLEALNEAEMNGMAAMEAIILQILPLLIYVLVMMALSLAGLILFCINVRNISFQQSQLELAKGTKLKTVYLNFGMVLFIASSLALVIFTFIV